MPIPVVPVAVVPIVVRWPDDVVRPVVDVDVVADVRSVADVGAVPNIRTIVDARTGPGVKAVVPIGRVANCRPLDRLPGVMAGRLAPNSAAATAETPASRRPAC